MLSTLLLSGSLFFSNFNATNNPAVRSFLDISRVQDKLIDGYWANDQVCLEQLILFCWDEQIMDKFVDMSYQHWQWIKEKNRQGYWLTIDEQDYWKQREKDIEWRWSCWIDLRNAVRKENDLYFRLWSLNSLKMALGEDNYLSGTMPYPLPIWCYEIRND